ncbi:MarR family winged helix-turn-helix transcriptional regulator [Kribbella sp. DT2]|uniref:MarR family winged helix-turn-helix transcriptional regulator n=1 Tax=Kribbella sp. DT2 TaxID=3393427 RepID=UPI003CF9E8E1
MTSDLGAVLSRLLEVIVEREAPILSARELTMWEYVVLVSIADEPGLSQNELARKSRRDPTRLIRHLDELAERGLIVRDVDPADRRRRVVSLTDSGSALVRATQDDIRAMETTLLRALPPAEQDRLRRSLTEALGSALKSPTDQD